MEVRNNYSPAFTGIVLKSDLNRVQRTISHCVSDMLDYTDEYVKLRDNVDVYFLPGKSEKSVIVKFMDSFSDMFFRKGKDHVQTTIEVSGNYSKAVDNIQAKLKGIDEGRYELPEYDEVKFLTNDTDLAKLDPDAYAELAEDVEAVAPTIGKEAAESLAVDSYQKYKKVNPRTEV